jgi:hypothetical protein
MPANITPIFPLTPDVTVGNTVSAANTALNGTGTVTVLFTAGADGSRIDYVRIKNTGTAVATAFRLFINNGGDTNTATNNSLIAEQAIVAYTLSQTAASTDYVIPLGISIPVAYRLTASVGTVVATPLVVTVVAGDY